MKVFVYGSMVTKGRYHQHYLGGKPLLGTAVARGYTKYILGGVHGMLPEEGKQVEGEVYELDEKALDKLDFFLNTGDHFTRTVIDVELENGDKVQAETHIWNGSVA